MHYCCHLGRLLVGGSERVQNCGDVIYGKSFFQNSLTSWFFSILGWKSKGLKSKGHYKSKGHCKSKSFKAFKGTKAKSYIHKGLLAKRSAEPGFGWSWSRGFFWKGHSWKGKSFKGKFVEFTIQWVLF